MIFPERDAKSAYDTRSNSGTTAFTDSTVKADTPAQEPVFRQDSGDPNPPPYNTPGSSSAPSSSTPSVRVNHLYLVRQGDSVSGSYTVDLDLVVPPQLLPNLADGEALENLKLASNNSNDRLAAKGFIGDWSSSGYGDVVQAGTEWTGDELFASSKWGRVKVFYTDELNAAGGGFFSSWFKGFT
ncbi:hypothetical protein FRC00_002466 [Tulasnella sp. 408]|nr:hypothetical protein FRC00_002466 [Tulasnella sp. 408]